MKNVQVRLNSGAEISVGINGKGRETVSVNLPDRVVWIELSPHFGVTITTQGGLLVSPGDEREVARLPWGRA